VRVAGISQKSFSISSKKVFLFRHSLGRLRDIAASAVHPCRRWAWWMMSVRAAHLKVSKASFV
jgi:hypothetical protein